MPKPHAANAEQLRKAIDRGRTGDKASAPDPAMAPLGTDAEAGGFAPNAAEVELAHREETTRGAQVSPPPANRNTAMPLQPDRGGVGTGTALALMALALTLCAILALVLLAA